MARERELLDSDHDDNDYSLESQTTAAINYLESLDTEAAPLGQVLQHFRDFNEANNKHANAAQLMRFIYEWA